MAEQTPPSPGGAPTALVPREGALESGSRYRLEGEISQVLRLEPGRDDEVWAQKGALVAYGDGIDWHLKVPGGLGASASRMLAGEGLALTFVQARRPGAEVALASASPGKIAVWDLSDGGIVCTAGAFLAAVGQVDIRVTLARRAGAAFFGGAGLLLQRITGRGLVFIHGSGDFVPYDLGEGDKLRVSTGNLAAFSDGVDYGIRGVGGCAKILFGREGLFMTELVGPGRVYVQTLKRQRLPGRPGAR
jgi:uncharacterized protein (TIGR00266 family)